MKRRYKLLLIIIVSAILVIISYFVFYDNKKIYLAIGDSLSNNDYSYINYIKDYYNYDYKCLSTNYLTIEYLIDSINNNDNKIGYFIKNANIITISLGTIELYNYEIINDEIIIEYLNNLYILLSKIRSLNKNPIYLINLYNNDYFNINDKIKNYIQLFNLKYISYNDLKDYSFILKNKTYLTYEGHKKVYNIVKRGIA